MRRYVLTLALVLAACGPGVYTRAEVVYAEPAQYVYVEPVDRVVVVTREVLVARGYHVYRVEDDGPTRVIWARRGDEEVVRVFATREGERVLVRGIRERALPIVSPHGHGRRMYQPELPQPRADPTR